MVESFIVCARVDRRLGAPVAENPVRDLERGGRAMPPRKREMIEPNPGDKRYIRRNPDGEFTKDQVDVNKSLSDDDRRNAKRTTPEGQGNRGDRHTKKR